MHILLTEDDPLQARQIVARLSAGLPDAVVQMATSEAEFRDVVQQLWRDDLAPELIVLDLMLRWSGDGSRSVSPPDDVASEGFTRAGIRCLSYLRSNERTAVTPVIFYSVVPESELISVLDPRDQNTFVCGKTPSDLYLLRTVRSVLAARGSLPSGPKADQTDHAEFPNAPTHEVDTSAARRSQQAAATAEGSVDRDDLLELFVPGSTSLPTVGKEFMESDE